MADFVIKTGNRLPAISATLTDQDGVAVNITGGTVLFRWRLVGATSGGGSGAGSVVSGAAGTVSYSWGASDTTTPGTYHCEWVITIGGLTRTFPSNGHSIFVIVDDLA